MQPLLIVILVIATVSLALALLKNGNSNDRKDPLRAALTALLGGASPGQRGGFVVFSGDRDKDYVQFSLEPRGLMFNWPTVQDGGLERLQPITEYLTTRGYVRTTPESRPAEHVNEMRAAQFVITNDGLYCQVGRDVEEARTMTVDLLRDVFGVVDPVGVQVRLEVAG